MSSFCGLIFSTCILLQIISNKAILTNETLQMGIFLRRFTYAGWPKYCKNNIDHFMILN